MKSRNAKILQGLATVLFIFLSIAFQNCAPTSSFSTLSSDELSTSEASSEALPEVTQPQEQIPAPAPNPAPASNPAPAPAPNPGPNPTPAPVPNPVPMPMPNPMPAPVPMPAPAPVPEPSAELGLYNLYVSKDGSDSNNGSKEAPFATLTKATKSLKPGTVVHVAPGNYSESISIAANGTAANRIRFVSTMKWGAKILGGSMGLDGSYIDVEGFELNGQNRDGLKNGITTKGSYNRILSNHVFNIATDPSVCTELGGSGINAGGYYKGVQIDVIGNVVHHIGSTGCKFIQGIYPSTSGTVKNNLIYNIGNWGIHLWHDAGNLDVVNNTIVNSGGGITVGGGGFWHKEITDYVNVSNNIVAGNDKGILEQGENGAHNTYVNNLTFNNLKYNTLAVGTSLKTGNVVGDPQFVNAAGNDYRLKSTSPAIDKGSSMYAPLVDINGRSRPQGKAVDMGAYEF